MGFLGPFTTSFPLIIFYGLVGHHSCYVSPLSLPLYSLGFLSPFTSSLPLFTPMGFLLDSLGFLSPFTISLPIYYSYRLIDPYSCHVNPTKFTTLFFRLPLPVYFLFPSRYSYGLATLFLGLLQPIYFFFISCYFYGLVGYQSCHINPLGLLPYFFYRFAPLFLPISLIVRLHLLLGLLSKISINTHIICFLFYFT